MATYNTPQDRSFTTPGAVSNLPYSATVTDNKAPLPVTAGTKPFLPPDRRHFVSPDPLFQMMPVPNNTKPLTPDGQMQQNIQTGLPFKPNNGNPQGANNMPQFRQQPSPQRRAYLNNVSGQQGDLGRYRPPTLAGNGNDPTNWNDYGGYDYNLPSAYGPTPNTPNSQGPYGGYPSYLQPNWMRGAGSAPRPFYPNDPMLFPGGG